MPAPTQRYDPPAERHQQTETDVPAGTKAIVVLFLTAFIVCGGLRYELWPFTGWRLFSQVRTASQSGWQATALDHRGHEAPIDFGALPRGFHGSAWVMRSFPSLSQSERKEVCRAWATAMRERDIDVTEIRVYRTRRILPLGRDAAPRHERRELAYRCDP